MGRRALIDQREKCERCRESDKRVLVVHHKDRVSVNNTPINLEVLCTDCHKKEAWEKMEYI